MSTRRTLLGRFALDAQLETELARSGLLELTFTTTRPDATLVSLDGLRSLAWVTPAGTIGALLVQDYTAGEDRTIPFTLGDIEVVSEGAELVVFLHPPAG